MGWDWVIFPKFLESRCGLREMEGPIPTEHLQWAYVFVFISATATPAGWRDPHLTDEETEDQRS